MQRVVNIVLVCCKLYNRPTFSLLLSFNLCISSCLILFLFCSDGRRPLMGGNWKLNPTTLEAATKLAKDLASITKDIHSVDTVIFPPFPLIPTVHHTMQDSRISVGAQDVFYETSGAYTGAVSTNLLKEVGAKYVLVGHSERRTIFKEDDNTINKKVKKVLQDGLRPLLCIGESKEEYEAGLNQQVCAIQLLKDLQDVSAADMAHVVIACKLLGLFIHTVSSTYKIASSLLKSLLLND